MLVFARQARTVFRKNATSHETELNLILYALVQQKMKFNKVGFLETVKKLKVQYFCPEGFELDTLCSNLSGLEEPTNWSSQALDLGGSVNKV